MVLEIGTRAPRRTIQDEGRTYFAVTDLVLQDQLIVAGRVLDALTGEPWRGPFAVRAVAGDPQRTKVGRDGFFAVAADPRIAFPLLAAQPYTLEITLTSRGFRPVTLSVNLPAGATFPRPEFEVGLVHLPITLAGRVVEATVARAPIPGALVTFADDELALLRTPLHFDHPAGTEVRAVALNPAGALRTLARAADRGATELRLSSTAGLGPGSLLELGPERRREVVVIANLPGAPGLVRLTAPLARSFVVNTAVQPVNAVDQPPAALLDAAVFAGGAVLPLTAGVAAAALRIRPLAAPELEIHRVGALTDADGYFVADGIDRPRLAAVRASAAGFLPGDVVWAADFRTGFNRIDFALET